MLRRAVVVIEESTETLATANPTHPPRRSRTIDELISGALVVALAMVVLDKLGQGSS